MAKPGRFGDRRRASASGAPSALPRIDGFSDLAVIGRGATATVYRAVQDGFDRVVAVKVLNVDISDRRAQKRFQRERSLNGRLSNHPNVVTVLDSGFVDGRYPYLAMEFFEQGALADRLKANGPFDVPLVLHVGIRIAGALETAHRLGVLHRDVKPHNVLLSRFGEPALADFGIAAILEIDTSVTAALTPVHAAPELLEGGEPTAQTDVYALGSTLYTLLAGTAPFAGPPGEGMLAQLLRITTSDVPALKRSDLPTELFDELRTAMAKRPAERHGSAAEFGGALQRVQRAMGLASTVLPVDVPLATEPQRPATAGAPSNSADTPLAPAVSTAVTVPPAITESSAPPTTVTVAPGSSLAAQVEAPRGAAVPPLSSLSNDSLDDDDRTIDARQMHPVRPPEPQRRRKWRMVSLVAAASVVAGAGVASLIGESGGGGRAEADPSKPTSSTSSTSSNPSSPTSLDVSQFAPTDVSVTYTGDVAVVRWTDQTNGVAQHILSVAVEGADVTPKLVDPGRSSETVTDIDPKAKACFVVSAVVDVPDDSPIITADGEEFCVNGAQLND